MAKGSAARAALTPRQGEGLFSLNITLEGEDTVVRRLRARVDRMRDLTPAWPQIDEVLRAIVRLQASSEGGRGGAPWQPLAKRTQDERRRLGYGPAHMMLQRTGALVRSLTSLTGDTITVHEAQYYAFGSADPKFKYHQSNQPRARLPRRALLQLTADDKNDVVRPIRVYLREGLSGAQP